MSQHPPNPSDPSQTPSGSETPPESQRSPEPQTPPESRSSAEPQIPPESQRSPESQSSAEPRTPPKSQRSPEPQTSPKSQRSSRPQKSRPKPKPASGAQSPPKPKPASRPNQVLQVSQKVWQIAQPVLLKLWQLTRQILDQAMTVLEAILSKSSIYRKFKAKLDSVQKGLKPLFDFLNLLWTKILLPLWNKVVRPLWGQLLQLLRPRLPEPLRALSNRILTIAILGPLLLCLGLFSVLTSGPAPVTAKPPPVAPRVVKSPTAAPAPPSPQQSQHPSPKPTPIAPKPVEPAPVGSAPSVPATPAPKAEPTPTSKPRIEPKPIFELQAQVVEVTDRYSEDLIQGVDANFQDKQLVFELSDRWYSLNPSQQDDLGMDVLRAIQEFDFETLELCDSKGNLLARNPVVGANIIVLQRRPIGPVNE